MLGAIKKYSALIHLTVLASVYTIYYAFPPYATPYPGYFAMITSFLGFGYGVAGVLALKNSITMIEEHLAKDRKEKTHNAYFYLVVGALIFLAETIRTAGH